MMKTFNVVPLKDVLLGFVLICGATYFFTKKKVKKDIQAEIDAAYRRGYNECLDNLKKKETA